MQLLHISGARPGGNGGHLFRVYLQGPTTHNVPQVLNLRLAKVALLAFGKQLMCTKLFEDPTQMLFMLLHTCTIHQQVIKVHKEEVIQSTVKHIVHQTLESARSIGESKGQNGELIQTKSAQERGFRLIPRVNGNLVISLLQVNAGNHTGIEQTIQQIVNARYGILVLDCLSIQGPVVNAHTQGTISLACKQDRSPIRTTTRSNPTLGKVVVQLATHFSKFGW